jgi:hypothetical protein
MTHPERLRRYRLRMKAQGLCVSGCGRPAEPNRTRCANHAARLREDNRVRYRRAGANLPVELAQCPRCRVPLLPRERAIHVCERPLRAVDFLRSADG